MQMQKWFVTLVLLAATLPATAGPTTAPSKSPTEQYLDLLDDGIAKSRLQMPQIIDMAQHAAKKITAGGTLWAAGRQTDFPAEAGGRAGGLMGLKTLGNQTPKSNDVVLYATTGMLSWDEKAVIGKWTRSGTEVILFYNSLDASIQPSRIRVWSNPFEGLHLSGLKGDKVCPTDTVENIINLWVWTGEFAAACTRAGKMPVFYKSIGLPGGRERIAKYTGKIFHDDVKIKPVAPGMLGSAYLDQIQSMLKAVRKNELPNIRQTAAWLKSAGDKESHIFAMGHMFPVHFQDPRAPQKGAFRAADQSIRGESKSGFVFYIGYQYPPQPLIDQAKGTRFKLAYMSVQPGKPAEPVQNVLYINPHWPLADACVNVPGYDIPILPASGVIDAAIYWATLAEACR